jgi:hypothetical protein
MSELWPSTLQELVNTDFEETPIPSYISTDMEIGPPKKRVRFTRQRYSVIYTIWVDKNDYETFFTWFESTMAFGSKSFLFTHPITGETKEYIFKNMPTVETIGPLNWSIKMDLEEA